jgi:hypothetical protein
VAEVDRASRPLDLHLKLAGAHLLSDTQSRLQACLEPTDLQTAYDTGIPLLLPDVVALETRHSRLGRENVQQTGETRLLDAPSCRAQTSRFGVLPRSYLLGRVVGHFGHLPSAVKVAEVGFDSGDVDGLTVREPQPGTSVSRNSR